jgi:hypothetical protein
VAGNAKKPARNPCYPDDRRAEEMKRLNVTLVVEEDLLREARAAAARQHTSVNEMVRQFLKEVVNQESRRLVAFERIQHLLERPTVHLGGSPASRDELHER